MCIIITSGIINEPEGLTEVHVTLLKRVNTFDEDEILPFIYNLAEESRIAGAKDESAFSMKGGHHSVVFNLLKEIPTVTEYTNLLQKYGKTHGLGPEAGMKDMLDERDNMIKWLGEDVTAEIRKPQTAPAWKDSQLDQRVDKNIVI